MKRSDFKYTAFISYRHVEPDATIAAALHKAIETFKVPKEFYEDSKPPNFRVFRDREELSASDLSDSIQKALKNSYFLIVISSKRTPLSEWCTREVELFRKLHGDDRIISVLIEGEPHESFSKPLLELQKTIIDEAGEEQLAPRELLAADLRPEAIKGDFEGYESLMKSNPVLAKDYEKQALKLLKTEIYRIMAAILGCTYGDLKQRAKERRQRQIVRVSAFFAALFLAFGLFMFRAYRQENIARREAVQTNSTLMLNRSQELLGQGDKVKALLVARQAMQSLDPAMDKFPQLKSQHEGILSEALYPVSSSIRTKIATGNSMTFMALQPQGELIAAGLGNDGVGLFDAASGELASRLEGHTAQVKILNFSEDGKQLLSAGFDDQIIWWDIETKQPIKIFEHPGNPLMARFYGNEILLVVSGEELVLYRYTDQANTLQTLLLDPATVDIKYDEETKELLSLATPSAGDQLRRYDFNSEKWLKNYELPEKGETDFESFSRLWFSDDKTAIYASRGGKLFKIDRASGKELFRIENSSYGQQLVMAQKPSTNTLFVADNSVIEEYDATTGELLNETIFKDSIKDIGYHADTDTMALALNDGRVAIWQGGMILDRGIDLYGSMASEVVFSPSGERVYINSRDSKEIVMIDVAARGISEPIPAQVVATSPHGSHALFFDSEEFFIWDTTTKELKTRITQEQIGYPSSYVFNEIRFWINEAGTKVAIHDYKVNNNTRQDVIYIIDLANGTEEEIELPDIINTNDSRLMFLPGDEHLLLAEPGGIRVMDLQGKVVWEAPAGGLVRSLVLSQDGKQLGLNYLEGNAGIFDLTEKKVIRKLPGQILRIDDTTVKGLYNRSVYQSDGEDIVYRDLPPTLDQSPVGSFDYVSYHEPSDQLLIIRNGEDRSIAYLLRFSTGELLRSFELPLDTYAAKGFFQADGELVMDQSFHSTGGAFDNPDSFKAFPQSLRFHFGEYTKMLSEEENFLGDRTLSDQEKQELGLDQ